MFGVLSLGSIVHGRACFNKLRFPETVLQAALAVQPTVRLTGKHADNQEKKTFIDLHCVNQCSAR
jgi:hypothetical protein